MLGTSCRDCVFAKYNTFGVQDDCEFDRLEKFAQTTPLLLIHDGYAPEDIEALLANPEAEDVMKPEDSKEYFYVTERICSRCVATSPEIESQSLDEHIKGAKERSRVKIAFIVCIDSHTKLEEVRDTLFAIDHQSFPCQRIALVISRNAALKPPALMEVLKSLQGEMEWSVELLQKDSAPFMEKVDAAANKLDPSECNYYAAFRAGQWVDRRFIEAVDYALNEQMDRFLAIDSRGSVGGFLVQVKIHQILRGSSEVETVKTGERISNIVDKIRAATEEDGQTHLLKDENYLSDIIRQLQESDEDGGIDTTDG